jgi:hypothetical protein
MKHLAIAVLVVLGLSLVTLAAEPTTVPSATPAKPVIQLALLLDTSNSMDGLIDQARSQLWTVVNHMAKTKKAGLTPMLQVALYEYGNDALDPKSGWVRQVLPFTEDLDSVSEKLFALRTNGGEEYCGAVITDAVKELKWSDDAGVYKTIFIAGNEPFTQGKVDYHGACRSAVGRGIVINTIHCGTQSEGEIGKWDDGARIGGGSFMCINQDKAIVAIAAPQDAEIAKLSTELNKTYVPYGVAGEASAARQELQDSFAASQPAAVAAGAPVQRAVSKANSLYRNSSWDLVDAVVIDKKVKLEDVKEADLPESIRAMKPAERESYLKQQAAARSEMQKKINALNGDREKFVAEKRKEAGAKDTLDSAILSTVDQQLAGKKFEQTK